MCWWKKLQLLIPILLCTNWLLLYWILVNTSFPSLRRYVGMKRKIDPLSHFSLLTNVWMPSTWSISYTINLLDVIPPYIKDQSVRIMSSSYTSLIAPKIFNYRRILQDYSIDDLNDKPPDCSCHNPPFKYSPAGYVILV